MTAHKSGIIYEFVRFYDGKEIERKKFYAQADGSIPTRLRNLMEEAKRLSYFSSHHNRPPAQIGGYEVHRYVYDSEVESFRGKDLP